MIYRNLAIAIAVTLSLALILEFNDPKMSLNLGRLEALGWVVCYLLAFLWLNNRIMLIGLSFITIYSNVKLWLDPSFSAPEILIRIEIMEGLVLALYLIGLACLTIALWPQFYPPYLTCKINWKPFDAIAVVLMISISIQVLGALN